MTATLPFTEIQRWACDAQDRGISTPERREAMPLTEFPDAMLEGVRGAVESDCKPAYWLDLGLAQIPSRAWFEWHWQRGIDPEARRTAIPAWIRRAVLDRDGNVCQICFTEVEHDDIHLDHIKPWSKGGEHRLDNLRVTHSVCNMRKAAQWDGDN